MSIDDGLILSIGYYQTEPETPINFGFLHEGNVYETNTSGITVVEDPMLGPSLQFTGKESFIEIAHANFQLGGDFSVGGWFKFNANLNWVRLIGKGKNGDGNESFGLWSQPSGNAWWAGQQGTIPQAIIVSREREINVGVWYHLMLVRQADMLTLYYNMETLAQQSGVSGNPQSDTLPLRIGYSDEYDGFAGEMAHLRLYNRALSGAEVQQVIQAAGVSMLIPSISQSVLQLEALPGSDFIKTHPIEFALFDQNKHYTLYIDDNPIGQPLEFEVHNISERDIVFRYDGSTSASITNHHFELQFRKGVLSANTLDRLRAAQSQDDILENSDSWDLFVPADQPSGDHLSLYLLYTGETNWPANTRRRLRFTGMNADASGGTRGTRVVMVPNQLTFVGSDAPITGKRTQHMSIVNHSGQKEIPLHVGFKGSNQVLNINGAESTLTLQIVNTLRLAQTHADIPTIALSAEANDVTGSRLILEFDTQSEDEEKAWALARASELNLTITAAVKRRGQTDVDEDIHFNVVANTQGISPHWEITPQQDTVLNSGDTVEIIIAGIRSSLPTGPANLYLHYDHITGYQPGRFVLPVLKSPLLFADGNVSIGRADPSAKLSIEAGSGLALRVEPNPGEAVYIGRYSQNSVEFNYASGQAINSTANISLNIDTNNTEANDRYIDFRANAEGFGAGQRLLYIREGGQVAIGGNAWAIPNNYMAAGSLTLGNINQNYGGGWQWHSNTAGLLLECEAHTEIAIHDAGTRVASLMYYDGNFANQVTLGRDMGWGGTRVRVAESLNVGMVNYAVPNNFMAAGSLTIGNYNQNYGGGSGWNNNTAGLLLECDANTEIAAHDAGTRIASLMYYQGNEINQITIGRDMGWGTTHVRIAGNLAVEGLLSKKFTRWWTLEISNDVDWGNTRIGLIENAQWSNSDGRLKTDVKPISKALDKLSQLKGVTYKWNRDGLQYLTNDIDTHIFAGPDATEEENEKVRAEARDEAYQLLAGTEVGLLAQDVEQVLPQLVRTDTAGYKSIRYDLLVALVVEAIKELNSIIDKPDQ